jgi:MOSC domain-containing protein YiiM
VLTPGQVRAGDPITVVHRPDHGVSVGQVFRATTLEPDLLPSILAAAELEDEMRERARTGRTFGLD